MLWTGVLAAWPFAPVAPPAPLPLPSPVFLGVEAMASPMPAGYGTYKGKGGLVVVEINYAPARAVNRNIYAKCYTSIIIRHHPLASAHSRTGVSLWLASEGRADTPKAPTLAQECLVIVLWPHAVGVCTRHPRSCWRVC